MAKCVLFAGQSLPNALCNWGSSTLSAHADTHAWNGSAWVAPAGDGLIMYANCLREALQEPIYLINACVDGTPLLNYNNGPCWSATGTGTLAANAISKTQAALGSVSGLCLDRIEWWQGQSDCMAQGYDMFNAPLAALGTLLSTFRSALGNDFRFCVWPVGKVSTGSTAQFIRAQMTFACAANACALGIEPGPASYDRAYADQIHLANAGEYACMGIRAARNALSYFIAKANAADTIPHRGAGPRIVQLVRVGSLLRIKAEVKAGCTLHPKNIWGGGDINQATGFSMAWGIGDHAPVPTTYAMLAGGYIRAQSSWTLNYPMWLAYQQERTDDASVAVYDDHDSWIGGYGQPMLPHVFGMSISA